MKELIKNALILCAITLVSGLLLGTVYEITKEPRAKQEEKTKQKSYKTVFKDADTFEAYELDSEEITEYLEEKDIAPSSAYINEIVTALDKKESILGYVITVTDKEGYGGDITFTVGIQNDGTINGISIMTISETAGLGMKAKEKKFTDNFVDKKVDSFVAVKTGASADNEVDAISGATITTNAVVGGVNAAIECFNYITENEEGGAGNE